MQAARVVGYRVMLTGTVLAVLCLWSSIPSGPMQSLAAQTKPDLVDINRATIDELKTLPGIRDAWAEAIAKNRPYKNKTQLRTRKIIPFAAYKAIEDKSLRGNRLFLLVICFLAFAALAWGGGAGFRSKHLLDDHFEKHGREFGHINEQQYLQLAQQLRDSHPGGNILEARRPDGVFSKFDRKRGYFGAYDPDGTIRTFFIPADGVRYFERQEMLYGRR